MSVCKYPMLANQNLHNRPLPINRHKSANDQYIYFFSSFFPPLHESHIVHLWLDSLFTQTTWCPCCALSCAFSGSSVSLSACGGPASGEKSVRGGSVCLWRRASTTSGSHWGRWRGSSTKTTGTSSMSAPSSWAPRIGPATAGKMRRRWRTRKSRSWWKSGAGWRGASVPSKSTLNLKRGPRTGWSAPCRAAAVAALPSKHPTGQASAQRITTVKMSIMPPSAKSTKNIAYELWWAGRGDQGHLRNKDWVFPHVLFLFSTSSRCFEANKVANFFLSFFLCTEEAYYITLRQQRKASLCFRKKKLLE